MNTNLRSVKITRGQCWPDTGEFTRIIPISNNARWKPLSPFKIGPFTIVEDVKPNAYYPDGIFPGFQDAGTPGKQIATVKIFENYWQYSKVYSVDVINGTLQKSFYERRGFGFNSNIPKRRVFPLKQGVGTITAYHGGDFHDYLKSRKFYCHTYSFLARQTKEYDEIETRFKNGEKIAIVGYDGIPGGENCNLTPELLNVEYKNPNHPFGHESVLCCMLLNYYPWLEVI